MSGDVTVSLTSRRLWRRVGAFVTIVASLLVLACVAAIAVVLGSDTPRIVAFPLAAVFVVFALAILRVEWVTARAWLAPAGSLTVADDTLVVVHQGVFRRPLAIPREAIAAVALAPDGTDRLLERLGAFLLEGVRASVPTDLASVRQLAGRGRLGATLRRLSSQLVVPIVGVMPDVPNVAIRFARPLALQETWPMAGLPGFLGPFGMPSPGDQVGGLLLRVDDLGRLEQALAARDLLGSLPDAGA